MSLKESLEIYGYIYIYTDIEICTYLCVYSLLEFPFTPKNIHPTTSTARQVYAGPDWTSVAPVSPGAFHSHGGAPKRMVYLMEIHLEIDDLGVPLR